MSQTIANGSVFDTKNATQGAAVAKALSGVIALCNVGNLFLKSMFKPFSMSSRPKILN